MDNSFDQHGINHATVAVSLEMNPGGHGKTADTLFIGGALPTETDRSQLARFALAKNYDLIVASFDPADPAKGPVGFEAVLTDGHQSSACLLEGRLWKRDRRTPAVLLFADSGVVLKISRKGRAVVHLMKGQYHDQGYDFAATAVATRAGLRPGRVPVVSQLGDFAIVLDVQTLAAAFEAA